MNPSAVPRVRQRMGGGEARLRAVWLTVGVCEGGKSPLRSEQQHACCDGD